ncbi:hypothetical protein FPV67DRAFT_1671735 [Lyophyllum atratum]|nr:hypothetical protein FPV67DRAFT_1671735 [Lyophyllum atratum]
MLNPLAERNITSILCTIPAIATTIYRLWIRRGRYWADDVWALCSALCQVVGLSATWVHGNHSSPKAAKIATYYLMGSSFYGLIWFARLSIVFSIIRIDPSETRRRRLFIVAFLFFLAILVLVSQLFWVCEPAPSWKEESNVECLPTDQEAILQIITDILSDTILIVAPLRILRSLQDKKLRRRLTVIFSTCLVITAVSLAHAILIFLRPGPRVVIAAIVEGCVSLIVCNVPVVVTSMLRMWQRSRQHDKANMTQLRFASHHPSASAGDILNITSNPTLGTDTWMNKFRWERELRDLEESRDSDLVTTVLADFETADTHMGTQHSDDSRIVSLAIERSEIDGAIKVHSVELPFQ